MLARRHIALLLSLGTVAMATGCGQDERVGADRGTGRAPTGSTQATFVKLRLAQLTARATLVVRGVPVSSRVRSFDEQRAGEGRRSYGSGGRFQEIRVRVREYIKGGGPRHITVRRPLASGAEPGSAAGGDGAIPTPRLRRHQVLFLDRGRGIWRGGYLFTSPQSLARVKGRTAIFAAPFPERGRRVRLETLRRLAR